MTRLHRGLVAAAGSALALCLLYRFDPVTTPWFPSCPVYVLTRLYCPGCGTLRGLHALVHGHVMLALRYNALSLLALPFLTYAVVAGGARQSIPGLLRSPVLAWSALYVLVGFAILRNLPWAPWVWLAPPQ